MSSRRAFLLSSAATLGLGAARPGAGRADKPSGKLTIRDVRVHELTAKANPKRQARFVEVVADSGLSGWAGAVFPETAALIGLRLRPRLLGLDALAHEAVWDAMKLADRHSRAGHYMMALSAVDIAVWDLRGKHFGVPVYRLLGGPTRPTVPVYASLLGYPTEPAAARKTAREYFDKGYTAQKWFFDHGPEQGADGFKKNVALVKALRNELGADAELMFDCKWAWDVPYAVKFAKAVRGYDLKWLEEPVRSENVEGYATIKRDGGVPMAGGEHLYSRWEVKPYLERGVLDYVQTDPEWCGGITELVKICALAEVYGVPVVPHGHQIWAALHVVASRPARVCPMAEYLFRAMPDKLYFQAPAIAPEKGRLALPEAPGLGFAIDAKKVGQRRELKW